MRRGRWLFLFVVIPDPLSRGVLFAIVSGQVVVEQGHGGVGVVLDPLKGRAKMRHKEGRRHLWRRTEALDQKVVALLQPNINGPHGLVRKRTDPQLFSLAVVHFKHLQKKIHQSVFHLLDRILPIFRIYFKKIMTL